MCLPFYNPTLKQYLIFRFNLQNVIWWWQFLWSEGWIPLLTTKFGWSVNIRSMQVEEVGNRWVDDYSSPYLFYNLLSNNTAACGTNHIPRKALPKMFADLSMNILHTCDKLPVQECVFKNSAGDSLPAVRFLGGLYNFCNFVIILSLCKSQYVKERHILQIWKWSNTTKKCVTEIASLQKLKTM